MGKGGDNNNNQQPTTTKPKLAGTDDFLWSHSDEPHASRRKAILKAHPEIKQLYGYDWKLKYWIGMVVSIQFGCAYLFRHQWQFGGDNDNTNSRVSYPWWLFWTTAYIVGGTCNHNLMMGLHELSHHLGFKSHYHNKLFSLFCNLPLGVPAAISFKRYHMDHHKYQGVEGMDVDIPTQLEGKIFQHWIPKFFFVLFQTFFYSLRPAFVHPKPPSIWEVYNIVLAIVVDAGLVYFWGPGALLYWLASSWLGMGMHPVAGHFIAEHYVFPQDRKSQTETYSYYGVVNFFTYNVGYHNEHHDFPFVAGSRLPQLHDMAKEFYQDLPHHTSYVYVILSYIFHPSMTAYSRVKRHDTSPDPEGVLTDDANVVAKSVKAE